MVTGLDDVIDYVVGLEIGAIDHITKPFHVREVLARVRAVLRRGREGSQQAKTKGEHSANNSTIHFFSGRWRGSIILKYLIAS